MGDACGSDQEALVLALDDLDLAWAITQHRIDSYAEQVLRVSKTHNCWILETREGRERDGRDGSWPRAGAERVLQRGGRDANAEMKL